MQIYTPQADEYKPLIRFLNKVFHKKFPRLLPKLYKDNPETLKYHYCVKENGKYLGAVAAIPSEITLSGQTLKGVGIGMVATAKAARGKGVMTALIKKALADAEGVYDISYLSGQRQRYQHFGYYPAGMLYQLLFTKHNGKKLKLNCDGFTYKRITDDRYNQRLLELYKSNIQYFNRTEEDIFTVLKSWKNKTTGVFKGEELVGYLNGKFHTVQELGFSDNTTAAAALYGFLKYKRLPAINVTVMPYQQGLIEALSRAAECVNLKYFDNFKIINYRSTVQKCLNAYSGINALSFESVTVEITGKDVFTVNAGSVITVADPVGPPDYVFTEEEFVMQVFGPLTLRKVPFKLPFALTHPDNV